MLSRLAYFLAAAPPSSRRCLERKLPKLSWFAALHITARRIIGMGIRGISLILCAVLDVDVIIYWTVIFWLFSLRHAAAPCHYFE